MWVKILLYWLAFKKIPFRLYVLHKISKVPVCLHPLSRCSQHLVALHLWYVQTKIELFSNPPTLLWSHPLWCPLVVWNMTMINNNDEWFVSNLLRNDWQLTWDDWQLSIWHDWQLPNRMLWRALVPNNQSLSSVIIALAIQRRPSLGLLVCIFQNKSSVNVRELCVCVSFIYSSPLK